MAFITGLLVLLGYISNVGLGFSSLKWTAVQEGKWQIVSSGQMTGLSTALFFVTLILSIFPAFFYVPSLIKTIRSEFPGWESSVSMRYALHYFALYQISYGVILTMHIFLPYPWFPEQSIGGIFEAFLPQFMMAVFGFLLFYHRLHDIGFTRPVKIGQMGFMVLVFYLFSAFLLDRAITLPIANFFGFAIDSWREAQISGEVLQARNVGLLAGVLEILLIGLFVPIAEEMMFRGVLQTALVKRFGAIAGVVGSGLIFALIHVDPVLFPSIFVMGVMLGWMRHYYRSIWASVLFHALNNTITVLIYFFQ
ncbi:CPBP family intramembrane glutamic endopeptidase [Aneurinibacillus tyrosinisolvens]|uniref:CPBP family intramembrane glutamic endopeptidase n=1 Tax=Aneurinibacillus tyrosinisolvens TaxID=1443435 RepID=UPI001379240E|nr:type II CAAX endopeptidase family protein [Aneurinibacillus tyrosinisolvens]